MKTSKRLISQKPNKKTNLYIEPGSENIQNLTTLSKSVSKLRNVNKYRYKRILLVTNIVDEVFMKLKKRNNKLSAYEYSTEWLKKSRGYYAYLKSSGADVGTDVLVALYGKTQESSDFWRNYTEVNKERSKEPHVISIRDFHIKLAERVEKELRKTAMMM